MKIRIFCALAALLAVTVAPAANAQCDCDQGAYIKAFGGGNWLQDIVSDGVVRVDENFTTGGMFGAALGYDYGDSRIEFEYSYRDNDINALSINGNRQIPFGGVQTNAYMFNYLREISTGRNFTPYLGAGIGIANVHQDVAYNAVVIDDDVNTLGYQFILGASTKLTDRVEGFIEWRYFGTSEFELTRTPPGGPQVLDSEYDTQNLVFGVTFKR